MLEYIVDGGIRYRDGVYCSVDNLGTEYMIRTHAAHVLLLQHTEFVLVVCTPVTYLICYSVRPLGKGIRTTYELCSNVSSVAIINTS